MRIAHFKQLHTVYRPRIQKRIKRDVILLYNERIINEDFENVLNTSNTLSVNRKVKTCTHRCSHKAITE